MLVQSLRVMLSSPGSSCVSNASTSELMPCAAVEEKSSSSADASNVTDTPSSSFWTVCAKSCHSFRRVCFGVILVEEGGCMVG